MGESRLHGALGAGGVEGAGDREVEGDRGLELGPAVRAPAKGVDRGGVLGDPPLVSLRTKQVVEAHHVLARPDHLAVGELEGQGKRERRRGGDEDLEDLAPLREGRVREIPPFEVDQVEGGEAQAERHAGLTADFLEDVVDAAGARADGDSPAAPSPTLQPYSRISAPSPNNSPINDKVDA